MSAGAIPTTHELENTLKRAEYAVRDYETEFPALIADIAGGAAGGCHPPELKYAECAPISSLTR